MSGTIDSNSSNKIITEIVEKNKEKACFELFGILPKKQTGTVKRTFLYKNRKFLVTLQDITDG